jgi:hypothetical protein
MATTLPFYSKHKWEDNIKMALGEMECGGIWSSGEFL